MAAAHLSSPFGSRGRYKQLECLEGERKAALDQWMHFLQQLAADACPAARSFHCAHQTLPALVDLLSAPAAPHAPVDAATIRYSRAHLQDYRAFALYSLHCNVNLYL